MTTETQRILQQALRLGPMERAQMIEALLRSFDESEHWANDVAWAAQAEARIDAFENGKLQADTAGNMFRRLDRR
ncbi:MAG: addiction module protein [Planctomycetes bacterium]|nr:addiction module protein [Planctomycetota bacterium]